MNSLLNNFLSFVHFYLFFQLFLVAVLFIFKTKRQIPFIINIFPYILVKIDFNEKFKEFNGGPGSLMRGLLESSKTFQGKCKFEKWAINYTEIEQNQNDHQFFFLPQGPEFCKRVPKIFSERPNKLRNVLFGPFMAPIVWYRFPNKRYCVERNFSRTLDMIGSYVVHSNRVKDHLTHRSGTIEKADKIQIMQACTNFVPHKIKPFYKRKWDVILYEKYSDSDRKKDGSSLYNLLLSANLSIKRLSYRGSVEGAPGYNNSVLMETANDSRFIVYYSFWDTGAISLKEIQNFGVYSFSVQKDLVYNETGLYVRELNRNVKKASKIIIKHINQIYKKGIDTQKMADFNQYKNSCQRSLEDLCNIAVNKIKYY